MAVWRRKTQNGGVGGCGGHGRGSRSHDHGRDHSHGHDRIHDGALKISSWPGVERLGISRNGDAGDGAPRLIQGEEE